jgi:hypothetical protein
VSTAFEAEPVGDVQRHIREQRAADRLRAEAVWLLHGLAQLTRHHVSRPSGDDVVVELAVPSGARRLLVASHPDVAARQATAIVIVDPAPPAGALPG